MSNQTPTERWAFFDCFSGVSGDMTLGALLDLGLDVAKLESQLNTLKIGEMRLEVRQVEKEHLRGVKVDFHLDGPEPERAYSGNLLVNTLSVNGSSSGRVIQFGFEAQVQNTSLSIQKVDLFTKEGRL